MGRDLASSLSAMSHVPLTDNLGKHFRVPSIHGWVTKHLYEEVIYRVSGRLEGWKAKFLSFAGRQTLV